MKKSIMGAITLLALVGCDEHKQVGVDYNVKYSSFSTTVSVIEVDSCEYLLTYTSSGVSTVHKQNCKYCLLRKSKQ